MKMREHFVHLLRWRADCCVGGDARDVHSSRRAAHLSVQMRNDRGFWSKNGEFCATARCAFARPNAQFDTYDRSSRVHVASRRLGWKAQSGGAQPFEVAAVFARVSAAQEFYH